MSEHSPSASGSPGRFEPKDTRVLLVDDEERFRTSLAQRLTMRGFVVQDTGTPEEAVKLVRQWRPDVVVLDRKMPGMQGEEVLRELKRVAPEVQVIILTGHASVKSAAEAGRLDAYAYLQKPCATEPLIATLLAARQEKSYAMARHEMPQVEAHSVTRWLWGTFGSRPLLLVVALLMMTAAALVPVPASLTTLLGVAKGAGGRDPIAGFSKYGAMEPGETIARYYSRTAKRSLSVPDAAGQARHLPLTPEAAGRKALLMVAILAVAGLFWATGALPVGITAFLVGFLMYLCGIFPPDLVAKGYAKDAVIFIMGVLALAAGIAKTGLDRRIGLLLLGTSRSLGAYLFLFCPLLSLTAAFLSEHALVAFIAPILMLVYAAGLRQAGIKVDRQLAVMLVLAMGYAANLGGPGSPAAGGRNAIMVGILADYGTAPTFFQWMKLGMPFVPVAGLAMATYFYLGIRRRVKVGQLDVAQVVKKEAAQLGPMTRQEYLAAVVLLLVVVLWITAGDEEGNSGLGMGGPVLLGIVLMCVMRIMTWRDVNGISWDVVALYGSASAMGAGLAATGAALWMAKLFVDALPPALAAGDGLAISSSLITALLTQVMSDGATVSAVGPITVPMATLSGTHPWKVGLATAFASSFANCFISGTPNNAIAFALARDLNTGEQLVTLGDFLKHGAVVTLLSLAVLWGWLFFGYWRYLGF